MNYTLLLYSDESDYAQVTPEQMAGMQAAFEAYTQTLVDAGVFVTTDWLQPSMAATTLTLKGGAKRVQDGPFANTKEQLGGYYVIRVADLDAAIAWAEKCPLAAFGTIEIRPTAMA
jgi:hypothetical protein